MKDFNELKADNEKLKEELKTYQKMFDNEEFRVALTDVRTGERELWQKYKPRMIKYKQCLDEIEEILNSYCENMCYGCSDDCVTKEVLQLIKQAKDEL